GLRVERRDVDQVQQQARTLQVPQETVAQPGAFGRAFDQPGDVGDDETLFGADAHDTEVRMQRRERIVGDLRPRVADRSDQRRLAGVRQAEQSDVGKDLEFELQASLLARRARRALSRRAVRARLEVDVAPPALAALGQQLAFAVTDQIDEQLAAVLVEDLRADRHAQFDVLGSGAVLVGAATALAVAGLEPSLVTIVDQRVDVAIGYGPDAAAAPA